VDGGAIEVSGGVAMGLLEDHPAPIYPIEAKQAGVSGGVVLGAVIGKDGLPIAIDTGEIAEVSWSFVRELPPEK